MRAAQSRYTKQLRASSGDLTREDVARAGGKGAGLCALMRSGVPVPDGFVITVDAFERFLHEAGMTPAMCATMGERARGTLVRARIPSDIANEILAAFDALSAIHVAVRSSATAEDSRAAAWAGQLATALNVTRATLLKEVRRCWVSLFTPHALAYGHAHGADATMMAIVVQTMVQSEKAGVAFSVHPVSEDRDHILIESAFGLGEALVSGAITPDTYIVSKREKRIVDREIRAQTRGYYRSEHGGTRSLDLGRKGARPSLTDAETLALAELVLRVEAHFGAPQDIEWALADGRFYLLQSRPITTLGGARPERMPSP